MEGSMALGLFGVQVPHRECTLRHSTPAISRPAARRPDHAATRALHSESGRRDEPATDQCPLSQPSCGSRRALFTAATAVLAGLQAGCYAPAAKALDTSVGLRRWRDKIDGYTFTFPESWFPVSSSGNDVFFRNPTDVEENLFVSLSSPSTSKLQGVADLGDPQAAAARTVQQYLEELKTTRLGVRRDGEVVSASSRTGPDGRDYYDIQTRFKSYSARDQLDVSGRAPQYLEWDRNYVTVLGVANKRLYEFRLQSSHRNFEAAKDRLLDIATSFTCKEML